MDPIESDKLIIEEEVVTEVVRAKPSSPRWSTTTKLVVALTLAALVFALLVQFRNLVGPILLSVVLAYLAHPLAMKIHTATRIPWKMGVTLIYLLILVVMIGLLTWGGFAMVEQVQSLINFIQGAVQDLPALIEDLIANPRYIGPFVIDLTRLDLDTVTTQVLSYIQPVLTRLGTLVGTLASSAASLIGWMIFTLLISYFILSETSGATSELISLHIPGYEADTKRLGDGLGRTWNAFLRGQLLITSLTILLYTIILGILGVRYYFGLALLAGLARFVPYIGPAIAWTTYGLVSFFQGYTLFGITPLVYSLVVVGVAWVTDTMMDNIVVPRIMSNALAVHPAAVMVAALVAANLFGFIGVVLAAPVLASIKLILNYTTRKLSDQDPWEGLVEMRPPQPMVPVITYFTRAITRIDRGISVLAGQVRENTTRFKKKPDKTPGKHHKA